MSPAGPATREMSAVQLADIMTLRSGSPCLAGPTAVDTPASTRAGCNSGHLCYQAGSTDGDDELEVASDCCSEPVRRLLLQPSPRGLSWTIDWKRPIQEHWSHSTSSAGFYSGPEPLLPLRFSNDSTAFQNSWLWTQHY